MQLPLWSGRRLISLWQMITEYPVVQFWWLSHELLRLEHLLRGDDGGPGTVQVISSSVANFPVGLAAQITAVIQFAEPHCKNFGFQDTAMLPLWNIKAALEKIRLLKPNTLDPSADIARDLKSLRKTIEMELGKRKFVYVEPKNIAYFEQDRLYGDLVYETFQAARQDLKDAGNCLAISLPTACMFHLMRVTEHGLRSLARKMHVQLTHKGKNCPIEFGDWDKLITGIKNKITAARSLSAGSKKQAQLEMYSNAADHCEYMKDIWRNNLSHSRKAYIDQEALAALVRVGDFMTFLAKHL